MVLYAVFTVWCIAPCVSYVTWWHSKKGEVLESREARNDVVECYEGVFGPFLSMELSVDEHHEAERKCLDVVRILRPDSLSNPTPSLSCLPVPTSRKACLQALSRKASAKSSVCAAPPRLPERRVSHVLTLA